VVEVQELALLRPRALQEKKILLAEAGSANLTGENLKVVWAKFSTLI
jgi:hypothetical protein